HTVRVRSVPALPAGSRHRIPSTAAPRVWTREPMWSPGRPTTPEAPRSLSNSSGYWPTAGTPTCLNVTEPRPDPGPPADPSLVRADPSLVRADPSIIRADPSIISCDPVPKHTDPVC